MNGIPPAPRGTAQIEVTFEIDENSLLTVSANEKLDAKHQLDNYIYQMRNQIEDKEKLADKLDEDDKKTNTDDLSPAPDAFSRPDIPLHGLAMLKMPRDGITDAAKQIAELKQKQFPVVYVGDVVGTGSSRKSATNSILWYMGDDIPNVPNKRGGGFVLGGIIAPIFFNTMEDSGALPIELDVSAMNMGDVIDLYVYEE